MVEASCGSPVTAIIVVNAMKRPAITDIINVIDEKNIRATRGTRQRNVIAAASSISCCCLCSVHRGEMIAQSPPPPQPSLRSSVTAAAANCQLLPRPSSNCSAAGAVLPSARVAVITNSSAGLSPPPLPLVLPPARQ